MGISHVIRSQEFLPSVPKFLNLYEALGIEPPALATLPYVMGPDGKKKLSKRDGAKDVLDYRREGYLPEALINFLATLGWNDGTEQEIFSLDELIKKFQLDRVQRSGARFDEQRLTWMNGHYIREISLDDLVSYTEKYWPKTAEGTSEDYRKSVLALIQERLKFFAEIPNLTGFFFEEPKIEDIKALFDNPTDKQLKKLENNQVIDLLKKTLAELTATEFNENALAETLNNLLTKLDTKPGILFAAIRIAVTGAKSSPEISGTLAVLGKERSLARIQKSIAALEK